MKDGESLKTFPHIEDMLNWVYAGTEAYEAAGGGIRRDLFADEQKGVFLTDAGLLEKLARDRLADAGVAGDLNISMHEGRCREQDRPDRRHAPVEGPSR